MTNKNIYLFYFNQIQNKLYFVSETYYLQIFKPLKIEFYLIMWYLIYFYKKVYFLILNLHLFINFFKYLKFWFFLQTTFLLSQTSLFKIQIVCNSNVFVFYEINNSFFEVFKKKILWNTTDIIQIFYQLKQIYLFMFYFIKQKRVYNSWSTFLFKFLNKSNNLKNKNNFYLSQKQFYILKLGFTGGLNNLQTNSSKNLFIYDINNCYASIFNFKLPYRYLPIYKVHTKININKLYGFAWILNLSINKFLLITIDELKILIFLKIQFIILKFYLYSKTKILQNFFKSTNFFKINIFLKKHYFKIFHNFLYGNLGTNRLYSFINFYNLVNQLRPLQISSTITSYSRLFLIKFLNRYFPFCVYYDKDSFFSTQPFCKKLIQPKIFFLKISYKKTIITFYWLCLSRKTYIIIFLNSFLKKFFFLIRYKSYNFQLINISRFYYNVFFRKQKKISYKLLKI